MKIIKKIDKMKTYAKIMRKDNKLIGFVPTMGYFHEGHLSLVRAARKQCDVVVVSIFVNPMQFGPNEDFKSYPRDFKRDEELAKSCGTDILFYPEKKEMYPDNFSTFVEVEKLTGNLCGKSRKGHFKGVTTVVMKLFEMIKPDIVYFGQKDVQQALVIKKMIQDMNMDVTVKIMPIVREKDGLAMSSRNIYLTKAERKQATVLKEALVKAEEIVDEGEKDPKKIIKAIRETISKSDLAKIDYVSIVDTEYIKDVTGKLDGEILIALAVFIGKTRLIDNMIVNLAKKKEAVEYHDTLKK